MGLTRSPRGKSAKVSSISSRKALSTTKSKITVAKDSTVPFQGYFIRGKTKTEQRQYLAEQALTWLQVQKKRGARGAVVYDIDDTILDGNETVQHGFQFMQTLFNKTSLMYPIHIVTARPDDNHDAVMQMLQRKGFCIPSDRLHMLPAHLWGKEGRHVEEFKWKCSVDIALRHGGVVARFGDKLWDVAHIDSLHTYLGHIRDRDCYVFLDPKLKGTFSGKLPGA